MFVRRTLSPEALRARVAGSGIQRYPVPMLALVNAGSGFFGSRWEYNNPLIFFGEVVRLRKIVRCLKYCVSSM